MGSTSAARTRAEHLGLHSDGFVEQHLAGVEVPVGSLLSQGSVVGDRIDSGTRFPATTFHTVVAASSRTDPNPAPATKPD